MLLLLRNERYVVTAYHLHGSNEKMCLSRRAGRLVMHQSLMEHRSSIKVFVPY